MTRFRILKAGKAALVGLMVLALPAAAADQSGRFDLSVSGLNVGVLSFALNTEGNRYAARAEAKAKGLAGALVDFYFGGSAQGVLDGARNPIPVAYDGTRTLRDDDRRTQIAFKGGIPSRVTVTPPKAKERDWDVDPLAQGRVLDPVSAEVLGDVLSHEAVAHQRAREGTQRRWLALPGDLHAAGRVFAQADEEKDQFHLHIVLHRSRGHDAAHAFRDPVDHRHGRGAQTLRTAACRETGRHRGLADRASAGRCGGRGAG